MALDFYDGDAAFNEPSREVLACMLDEHHHFLCEPYEHSNLFLKSLLANDGFKAQFVARADSLLSTHLSANITRGEWHRATGLVASDVEAQSERTHIPENMDAWLLNINHTEHFFDHRPCAFRDQLESHLHAALPSVWCGALEPAMYALKVKPNPSSGPLNLQFESDQTISAQLRVRNLTGILVHEETVLVNTGTNRIPVNMEAMPAGVYFYSLASEVQVITAKGVVVHR